MAPEMVEHSAALWVLLEEKTGPYTIQGKGRNERLCFVMSSGKQDKRWLASHMLKEILLPVGLGVGPALGVTVGVAE